MSPRHHLAAWLLCMLCCAVLASAHSDCSTRHPSTDDVNRVLAAERALETSTVLSQRTGAAAAAAASPPGWDFVLSKVPVHFHILTNNVVNTTRVNVAMAKHMVEAMNEDFNGFVTFVYSGYNVTRQPRNRTCDSLLPGDYAFVKKVANWKLKFHIVICEMAVYSGSASLPGDYTADDPRHNLVHVDYRAVACRRRDNNARLNNATCDPKWWRTRNVVAAHEFGHILGLYHTFTGDCTPFNDGIDDTPAEASPPYGLVKDCPGLVRPTSNCCIGTTKTPTTGQKCTSPPGCNSCPLQDAKGFYFASKCPAVCCLRKTVNGTTSAVGVKPLDTCPKLPGVDPVVNFMSYSPDYCLRKGGKVGTNVAGFTPGQVNRMRAMISDSKPLIYKKYCRCPGNVLSDRCYFDQPVPCDELIAGR